MEHSLTPGPAQREGDRIGPLAAVRSSEVPLTILGEKLGEEVEEVLSSLRPTLIAWDITEDATQFFLDHSGDMGRVHAFCRDPVEGEVNAQVRWYLQELRQELSDILASGVVARSAGARCTVAHWPCALPPIRAQDWDPATMAFVEQLRPRLEKFLKAHYVDHWLQNPIDTFDDDEERGGRIPMQMIQRGHGDRLLAYLAYLEEIRYQEW